MFAKKPLTPKGIEALKPGAKARLVWDAVVPGFAVRCAPTGAKSFVLVGRFGSPNPTARSIGKVGALTLEDARAKAREWLKLVASGKDPAQVEAKAERDTLAAICGEYLGREGPRLRSAGWIRGTLDRLVLPELGQRSGWRANSGPGQARPKSDLTL